MPTLNITPAAQHKHLAVAFFASGALVPKFRYLLAVPFDAGKEGIS